MTPQSNFMVAAPIAAEREDALRAMLATMSSRPGVVDPNNSLLPFAQFERLHVARFVILHDETLGDLAQYGESFPDAPVWLVFLGDCDGPADNDAAGVRDPCGCRARANLLPLPGLRSRRRSGDLDASPHGTPAAQYINWVGRTVRQISRGSDVACARCASEWCGMAQHSWSRLPRLSIGCWPPRCGRMGLTLTPPAAYTDTLAS